MQLYPVVLQNKHRFVPSAVSEVFIKRRKDDYWRVFTLQFHFDQALPERKYIYIVSTISPFMKKCPRKA